MSRQPLMDYRLQLIPGCHPRERGCVIIHNLVLRGIILRAEALAYIDNGLIIHNLFLYSFCQIMQRRVSTLPKRIAAQPGNRGSRMSLQLIAVYLCWIALKLHFVPHFHGNDWGYSVALMRVAGYALRVTRCDVRTLINRSCYISNITKERMTG